MPAGPPLYLRVAVRAGGSSQFSYSTDNQKFTPLGAEFVTREGKWVGTKMGLFCLDAEAQASTGQVAIDWWHVIP